MKEFKINPYQNDHEEETLSLYRAVGWSNYYERPDMLRQALSGSLLVLGAFSDEKLIGLIRVVGDGASILYIQDLLVLPAYQRKGVGTALLRSVFEMYPDVYQIVLMTDNTPKTAAFYRSLSFVPMDSIGCVGFIYCK